MIYELKAGGVDQRRVLGEKLEKLAEGESGEGTRLIYSPEFMKFEF